MRLLTLLLALLFTASPALPAQDGGDAIEISAKPILHFYPRGNENRFGQLRFIGGLHLKSANEHFGGFSGLSLDDTGTHLIAISDRGYWLKADLHYEGERPVALENASLAPIIGPGGRPLPKSRDLDTESLTIANGYAYVGIERSQKIMRFDMKAGGLSSPGAPIPLPALARRAPSNASFEALGVTPQGALVLVTESYLDGKGDLRAWILEGGQSSAFSVARRDEYDVSDLAILPSGDIILLERRYRPPFSLSMRLRRLSGADLKPGARLDGPVLMESDLGFEIDNMEGIAVHHRDGKTILTLISDDNFNFFERTLLLQFELVEP